MEVLELRYKFYIQEIKGIKAKTFKQLEKQVATDVFNLIWNKSRKKSEKDFFKVLHRLEMAWYEIVKLSTCKTTSALSVILERFFEKHKEYKESDAIKIFYQLHKTRIIHNTRHGIPLDW